MTHRIENTHGVPYVVEQFTVKETAAEIRKALAATFPGTKFSVRMARGTGFGWLDVSWTDGPTTGAVRAVTDTFRSERFDGSDDSYRRVEATMYAKEDGTIYQPEYSCTGANGSRTLSPAAETWAASVAVPGSFWWAYGEQYGDAAYYATRRLLNETDLSTIPPLGQVPNKDASDA